MVDQTSTNYLAGVIVELCRLPKETEWVEFKTNRAEAEEIGEYISALGNAAALVNKPNGYLVWGIEDGTHKGVGTHFAPRSSKVGNEELESWLARLLSPRISFQFFDVTIDDKHIVLLQVPRAFRSPIQFKGQEYIRIGIQKKKLKEFPEKERELWRTFDKTPFEDLIALENAGDDQVLRFLDYPAYFDLLKISLPENKSGILQALAADNLIHRSLAGSWDITNLGAILLAKQFSDFPTLARKPMRVIQYKCTDKVVTLKEQVGARGYANCFEWLIGYVNGLLPSNEIIGEALRRTLPMYPEIAVRELVANALIHQDFSITGAGPTMEIFRGRLEITNPGAPLIDPERF